MSTEAQKLTPDQAAGIAWWNGLSELQRAYFLSASGTVRVAEAWAWFKVHGGPR